MAATSHSERIIHFSVNGKPIETREHSLTVGQILTLAGLDLATHYLVEKQPHGGEIEHRNLDEKLHLHDKEEFLAFFTGTTPVS